MANRSPVMREFFARMDRYRGHLAWIRAALSSWPAILLIFATAEAGGAVTAQMDQYVLAIVCFLAAFGVVAMKAIASTKDRERTVLIALLAVLCFAGHVVWVLYTHKRFVEDRRPSPDLSGMPLRPAQDPTPMNPCDTLPPDALMVLFGNQVAVSRSKGRVVILRMGEEDMLAFVRGPDGGILLDATVRDENYNDIVKVRANVVQSEAGGDYYTERDEHTFYIANPHGAKPLYVRYLNKSAMQVTGMFYRRDSKPVRVEGAVSLQGDYSVFDQNCLEVTPGQPLFRIP